MKYKGILSTILIILDFFLANKSRLETSKVFCVNGQF